MKKIITIIILNILFACTTIFAMETFKNNIQLNFEDIPMNNPIYNIDNKLYVSCRELCEKLGFSVLWDGVENKAIIDTQHKKIKTSQYTTYIEEGVIPNEEIAYNIGKILLEKYSGKSLEYVKDNKTFYLTVDFHEETNTWLVYQTFKYNEEGGWIASGSGLYVPSIELNKSTGEVISINTYSSFLENIP